MYTINDKDRAWWKEAVVYQVYPRSFSDSNGDGIGDLKGVISKLEYLKDLGVDVVWLSPINKSPNDDNGYDISDYYDIMDEFGTIDDFKDMLDAIHSLGMKFMMDLVVNHTSDEHPWFIESKKSKDNPYRDFYYWRDTQRGREPNDWLSYFTGSAWDFDKSTDQYYLHLFSKKQPDLNWENNNVRNEIHNIMRYWLDMGVDGFRMDVINAISKTPTLPFVGDGTGYNWGMKYFMNGPRVHEFLNEMHRKVLSKYDVMTVGETSEITTEDAKKYSGTDRNELNMVFHFEHMGFDIDDYATWKSKPWSLVEMKKVMSHWQIELDAQGWNSIYLGNHDQTRIVSRFGDDTKYRTQSAKLLATMMLTMKGTPYIFQGEEIGMTNLASTNIEDYDDVNTIGMYNTLKSNGVAQEEIMNRIQQRSRDNARTPMQWTSANNAGFTDATPWIKVNENHNDINVEKEANDVNSILNYYKRLIHMRKQNDIFTYGKYADISIEDENIYAYTRELNNEKILVVLNFSKVSNTFSVSSDLNPDENNVMLSNYCTHNIKSSEIVLSPYEAIVFKI